MEWTTPGMRPEAFIEYWGFRHVRGSERGGREVVRTSVLVSQTKNGCKGSLRNFPELQEPILSCRNYPDPPGAGSWRLQPFLSPCRSHPAPLLRTSHPGSPLHPPGFGARQEQHRDCSWNWVQFSMATSKNWVSAGCEEPSTPRSFKSKHQPENKAQGAGVGARGPWDPQS